MPSTRIMTGEWARGRERELISAVLSALRESIKIPDWDQDVVVDIYNDTQRVIPPKGSSRYTRIEIGLYLGRTMEAKRALYRAVVHHLRALDVPENDIKTILIEFPLRNCAPHGSVAASDIGDLGYSIVV